MFVYCGNNPIRFIDEHGNRYCAATSVSSESADERATSCQAQIAIARKRGFERFYAEELAVLNGESSTYKGVSVYRVDSGGASFSCGVIFLDSKTPADIEGVRMLRHEYGHTVQLERLGITQYFLFVVFPSVTGFQMLKNGKLEVNYYSLPWEFGADLYGGVTGRPHYESEVLEWYRGYSTIVGLIRGKTF